MSLQEFAIKQLEQVKDFYMKDPSLMMEHYEHEKTTVQEYVDRELLELIQNADDAAKLAREPKAFIYLENGMLIVANTGQKFTEGGLDSLLHSNLSPKYKEKNQIGNKGLGFRAILGWADRVIIISGDLKIGFSKKNSISVLEELKKGNPSIKDKIFARYKRDEDAIALLRCPEIIEEVAIPDIVNGFDTLIILDLKEQVENLVEKQLLSTIDAEMMLFLNHLDSIEIQTPHIRQTLKRNFLKSEQLTENSFLKRIKVSKIDSETQQCEWNIYRIEGTNKPDDPKVEEKNYELAVAWQDELKESKNVLHSFFRTDVAFKFPGILHGTFELSSNRNELIKGQGHNDFLFRKVAELIADASQLIADNETSPANYKALKLAMIDFSSLSNLIKESNFQNILKDAVKQRRVFPTTGNLYLRWDEDDKPIYYEDEAFSAHLNPARFIKLLRFCHDEAINQWICSLQGSHYKIKYVIQDIALKKEQLSLNEYAKLIVAIHKILCDVADIEELALFYDGNFNLLNFKEPIFLPDTVHQFDLPADLGVQIISSQLANEIMKINQCENYTALRMTLHKFKLKEYKFTEVAEILIDHYSILQSKYSDIVALNQQLFKLYHAEQNPGKQWLGKPVHLIDKNGNRRPAGELYFGKDYGNSFIEDIYGYNKEKIVASQKKLKAYEIEENLWKGYLDWLGVASLPRKIIKSGESEYATYSMKNFDYKHEIEGYNFKNGYKDFIAVLTNGYSRINVTSMDDLENILKNNSSEKILRLIDQDESFRKNLEIDTEPESSNISFWFYNAKSSRAVYGNRMKSYLKWKIGHSAWLNTEGNEKCQPSKCSTAAYINEDFKGLVDKPKLDYDELKRYNINRDKADYFLNVIGVHKSINTFQTSMLYSILLNLPQIDPSGKKAKTIYNQLAANYTEKLLDKLDKNDPNYIRFHGKGTVYCKKGVFSPLKEAYYVNDKRYGESVVKLFNTIEIDKRRGKEIIKKLFGVEPLDKIELKLSGTPVYHKLNSFFESEMESFKPYVYVLRKEQDGGDEKNIIKDVRFALVTQIRLEFLKEGNTNTIALNDYEYYYLKKGNLVYLKVPDSHADIRELKNDINVCLAVAEAFSAILDVDSQRQQIRELFSKTTHDRDELLRGELDDDTLQKLSDARRLLGIANNHKLEFWKSFARCFKGIKIVPANETDAALFEQLISVFPQHEEIISHVFNEIHYPEINDEASCRLVVELFQSTGITIGRFNGYHYPSFNLEELYEISFKHTIDRNLGIFKSCYHSKCLLNPDLKARFLNEIQVYGSFPPQVHNEVDFNVEADLNEQVKAKYGFDIIGKAETGDVDDMYRMNLESVWQLSQQLTTQRGQFDKFIGDDIKNQSLLYFTDQINIVEERFRVWLGKNQADNAGQTATSKAKRIAFGDKTLLYDNFTDLKNQLESIIDDSVLKGISLNTIKTKAPMIPIVNHAPGVPLSGRPKQPKVPNEEVGFLGEYLVYRFLMESIDNKASVKWVSDYARDCGVNLNGKNEFGYDMEYIPNGAIYPRYVEVKVVSWDDAFHISSNEVKFGEKNKNYHEVFLVRNLDTPSEAKIEKIPHLFDYKGKSFNNNDLFSVINDKFIIKFNKVD